MQSRQSPRLLVRRSVHTGRDTRYMKKEGGLKKRMTE